MKINKFILFVLTVGAVIAVMMGTTATADSPKRGGTLIWAIDSTPRHLNPTVQSGIATGEPGTQLFASPLRYDEDWTPKPYLAQSWDISDDGLQITLHLVKGATFHDGQPITASDVAFSILTVKANHPFKTMFAPVQSIDTPNPHTAVINLSKPHPALLLAMSPSLLPIIPEHVYGDGQDLKSHPANSTGVVGSGPFKLNSFKRDQHIVLERYDDFFIEGHPFLDKIVMRIIKDGSARVIALENGEVHMAGFESNPPHINRLKKVHAVTVTDQGYAAIGPIAWVAFNTVSGPTKDVNVRRAVAYAIDRDFITQKIMRGTAIQAKTGIHPLSPFYEPNVASYDIDLAKANRILDEAGYPRDNKGVRFKMTVDYGWSGIKAQAEYLKPQLKKIGIEVIIRSSPDFPTWAKRVGGHEFEMTWDVVFNWGDPVIGVHRTYQSSNIKKGVIWSNTQSYANAQVDTILDQAGSELDPAKRKVLYAKFQRIVADEVPIYFIYALPYHTITSKKVGNPPAGIWATLQPMDRVYLKN